MFSRSVTVTAFLSLSLLAGAAAYAAPAKTDVSSPTKAVLPAALRPVLYRTLARDAGPAYAVGKNDCASVPDQRLTACFDRAGIHFRRHDRQLLTLALSGFGRGTHLTPVGAIAPTIHGNEITYHARALSAWWRVLPAGFEQGFTITRRPAGSAPLHLVLTADSSAAPTYHADQLRWGALRYGDLVTTDATGKVIPSTLTTKNGQVLIAVNDAHVTYPLTVDPLVWIEQKVAASDGAPNDLFGWSVAFSGTTALVGATQYALGGNGIGAAYVFTESGGTWTQTAKLTASDGAADDQFGFSVALDGTTAIVGQPAPNLFPPVAGAAYVFTESGGTWTQTQKLTANDGAPNDLFGFSVALDGTTALIGADQANVGGNVDQGAAYVFDESGGTWTQTQKLTASDGAASDGFGASVALDGATAVVGAPGGNSNQGAAYVFTESGGTWTQATKLTASDGAVGDAFGASVALAGSTALIGAPAASLGYNYDTGAAYVFDESGGAWTQTRKLTANDGAPNDYFGTSVALAGTTALIGAPYVAVGGIPTVGAAYVFDDSSGTWTQTVKLTPNDDGGAFGTSVAFSGTTALIGAWGATVRGNYLQGAAYLEDENDLALAVSAPAQVAAGSTFSSQTIATNDATADSLALTALVAVPEGASFVSASATQGGCNEASGVVTCEFGQISGDAGTATANVTLKATGSVGKTIDNTASIMHATPALTASAATMIQSSGGSGGGGGGGATSPLSLCLIALLGLVALARRRR